MGINVCLTHTTNVASNLQRAYLVIAAVVVVMTGWNGLGSRCTKASLHGLAPVVTTVPFSLANKTSAIVLLMLYGGIIYGC